MRRLLLALLLLIPFQWLSWATSSNAFGYTSPEGPVRAFAIEVGPFDLHRRYRSMEGPYASLTLPFGQLLTTQRTLVPEEQVLFAEGSMNSRPGPTPSHYTGPRELYWVKGLRVDVVDEQGRLDSGGEFVCHTNVDVDPNFRNRTFSGGDRCLSSRIFTLTQGQTEITFPDGFGVPVTSEEAWTFLFQAANRTTDEHRRVKHLCTLYLIQDRERVRPITALSWSVPYISVVVDGNSEEAEKSAHASAASCMPMAEGVLAPNAPTNSVFADRHRRRLSGHFVVPPGKHHYTAPISPDLTPAFATKDRKIQLAWSHVHPLCTECSLVRCRDQKKLLTARAQSTLAPGLQLKQIELFRSQPGIALAAGEQYELQATYDNVTGEPQDSMVSMGMFFSDRSFVRPDLTATPGVGEVFCGIAPPSGPPLFDDRQDGPLLQQPRTWELDTSAGPLRLLLDPALAPRHATQLDRLLKSGVFDGTPFVRYEPNFVLQLALAEQKVSGAALSEGQKARIRRLPLEVESKARHKIGWLTMARDQDPNSATTSFSVMLGEAPHLDGNYTVFGHILADEVSLKTLDRLLREFRPSSHWIRGARELAPSSLPGREP